MVINLRGRKFVRRRASWAGCNLLPFGFLLLSGCNWIVQTAQEMHLRGYDSDIKSATQAIGSAHSDGERAQAYSKRGSAYSEKARYSRAFKLIKEDEYERLFDLAVKDHDEAIALDPVSAEVYFNRGQAYYDRGSLDLTEHKMPSEWLDHAAADFETATEKNPHNFMAFDMLGLTHESNDEWDMAIHDYTREMAINPLGKVRLAGAYCGRGQENQRKMKLDAAAADYERSIDVDPTPDSDGCSCESYNSALGIYTFDTKEYDKAWEIVHKAEKSKQQISGELVDALKKASGRSS